MKCLHLSPGFNPCPGTATLENKSFLFSGGEVHIKLSGNATEVLISARLNNSDDVMKLLLATDALRRQGVTAISAIIPYLPYARQDRVMVDGEPLSVKVMCDMINYCGFDKVYVYDIHSDVSPALLNDCKLLNNYQLVKEAIKNNSDYMLVCPDAGALKKIYKVAQAINYTDEILLCNKVRDVSNGTIKRLTVDKDDLDGKDCFIVDDICDGGATFIEIAKVLRQKNAGRISLIVSHGIISKGEEELKQWLDHIYTTDSIKNESSSFVTRVPLARLIQL